MRRVDLIIPVYRGVDELERCIESVLANPQKTPFDLVLIDDCSPEPEVKQLLRRVRAENPGIRLLENATNLGFVATVNRGMALHGDRDVVLLNSDTEVANDWLDRLVRCASDNRDVASVTPFSNNATICSFPVSCAVNELPDGWALGRLDALFSFYNQGESVEVPTGVGFCMYITRASLNAVGLFDSKRFGRGYGEENDFCMRASRKGWQNLLCCDTYVFHAGGVSFSHEKEALMQRAQGVIDRLYPEYNQLVQAHIAQDPAAVHRLNIRLAMLRHSPRPRLLFINHHLGGGTARHIRELRDYLKGRADILLIQSVGEEGVSLRVEGDAGPIELILTIPRQYAELLDLLRHIGVSRVHYHHTMGVDPGLLGVAADLGVPYDITLHDYYFINANATQTDKNGRFCPSLEGQAGASESQIGIGAWQENQRLFLDAAERVIAPSKFTAALYQPHFPELDIKVARHPDWEQDAPYPGVSLRGVTASEPLRILVLGAIGPEKGADILEQTAVACRAAGLPLEFHLLGYAYRPLAAAVREHGPYDEGEAGGLIAGIRPHLVWFPALCPETYSYTLSETLRVGLPVVAPDIGAFEERLAGRPFSWIVPWEHSIEEWTAFFTGIRGDFMALAGVAGVAEWAGQVVPGDGACFYRDSYLSGVLPPLEKGHRFLDIRRLGPLLAANDVYREGHIVVERKERILLELMRFRRSRAGRVLSQMIPGRLQRLLKRRLSSKPIHEIGKPR